MTARIAPDGLDPLSSASADGYYTIQKSGVRFREWYRLTAGAGVALTPNPATHELQVSAAITTRLLPLTTVIGGVPDLVWDADNKLVYSEVPA
ncbi:MAG: hypothetical protein J7518_20435 [Nocardioidaceae bacterium]|nr:hypothetical protein [Nocardioidaceae bacterium]